MLQIDIKNKSYGNKTILKNISFSIENPGIYGIVGKNGAGKTTFFNCLVHFSSFEGEILYKNQKKMSSEIGFIPTEPFLYNYLSVKEFYKFYALLTGITPKKDFLFSVDENLLIKELSTGMRKKCYINAVFQKQYDIYIFDEPFNGLDIESSFEVTKLIVELSKKHIVFLSSHILESLKICNSIFAFKNGNIQKFLKEEFQQIENYLFL